MRRGYGHAEHLIVENRREMMRYERDLSATRDPVEKATTQDTIDRLKTEELRLFANLNDDTFQGDRIDYCF